MVGFYVLGHTSSSTYDCYQNCTYFWAATFWSHQVSWSPGEGEARICVSADETWSYAWGNFWILSLLTFFLPAKLKATDSSQSLSWQYLLIPDSPLCWLLSSVQLEKQIVAAGGSLLYVEDNDCWSRFSIRLQIIVCTAENKGQNLSKDICLCLTCHASMTWLGRATE